MKSKVELLKEQKVLTSKLNQVKAQINLQEVSRMKQLAGLKPRRRFLKEDASEDSNVTLANKYYNEWLETYDSSEDFGDSTSFSGSDDDIINGNYESDESYPNTIGFAVEEVAGVYITSDKKAFEVIKNDYENYKEFNENNKYIIVVW